MKGQLRKSGIDIIGDVPWGTHFCQFYQTKEDLIEILVPYFKSGLENNELCVWVTSEPLKTEEAKEALERAIPDLGIYLDRGQIEIIPETRFYLEEGNFDPDRALNAGAEKLSHAIACGYNGLRISGNISWLKKTDRDKFTGYEEKVDSVIGNFRIIALCSYSLEKCGATEIIDVVANHKFTLIKREGKWEQIESPKHKKTEKALHESEEKYRYIVETANEGIWILDAEARTTYVNEKTAEMLGYKQEEMIGRSLWDFADEEGKAIFKQSLEKRRQGISEVYESKLIHKDGSPLWALICAKALLNKGGKFTGSLGMFTDITRRNQEEQWIRRYNHILEGINRIFSSVVQTKTEEELGSACLSVALEVTGSQFGIINEMGADGLLHDVAKSELACEQCLMYDRTGDRRPPSGYAVHGLYGSVINNEKGFFTNDPQSHPDSIGIPPGHPPLASFLGVPLIQDGKMVGLIAVANRENGYSSEQQEDLEAIAPAVTQVLQRKKAEKERAKAEKALIRSENKFRTLAENSPDLIARFDKQKRHLYVNPANLEPYGLPPEEIIGKTNGELGMDPELVEFWEKHYENIFTTGVSETMDFRYTSPDGKKYYFNTQVVPEFVDGKVTSVLAISHNITDIKETEAKLKDTLDNLENMVKERTKELERAYKLLKESEKGLAEAQKMAHLGSWDWNLTTGELYWSDEKYRIFGYSPQEFIPTYNNFLSFIHPEDQECVKNSISEALNGEAYSIDYRIIRVSGEERVVHGQGEAIFDEKHKPVRIRGTVQDITERKKTEEKLKESEDKLKTLFELLPVGVSIIDKKRNFLDANLALERILDLSREDLFNRNYRARKYLRSDGAEMPFEEFPSERALEEEGSVQSCEIGVVKENGSIIWTDVSATVLPFSDGQVVITTRDITESKKAKEKLQKAEEKYRIVTEQTGQLVYDYDMEKDVADLAGNIEEVTGFTPYEVGNIKLNFWISRIHPEDLNKFLENHKKYFGSDGGSYRIEYRFRKKNGEYIYLEDNWTFFRSEKNSVNRILGVIKDITERKKAEVTLANIETTRKKEIHHRIKNNLQVISSLLDLQAESFRFREHVEDSEVLNAFKESQDRVASIAFIHEELHEGRGNDTLNFHHTFTGLLKTFSRPIVLEMSMSA